MLILPFVLLLTRTFFYGPFSLYIADMVVYLQCLPGEGKIQGLSQRAFQMRGVYNYVPLLWGLGESSSYQQREDQGCISKDLEGEW